jgi:hypothetical protein
LLAQHLRVLFAGVQFLLLLRKNLFVNEIADLAHAADKDVNDYDKEYCGAAHDNRLSRLLPVDERIDHRTEFAVGAAGQVVDERKYRVAQAHASYNEKTGLMCVSKATKNSSHRKSTNPGPF